MQAVSCLHSIPFFFLIFPSSSHLFSLPSELNLPCLSSSKPSVVPRCGFGTQNEDDHLLCDWADSPRGLLHLYLWYLLHLSSGPWHDTPLHTPGTPCFQTGVSGGRWSQSRQSLHPAPQWLIQDTIPEVRKPIQRNKFWCGVWVCLIILVRWCHFYSMSFHSPCLHKHMCFCFHISGV